MITRFRIAAFAIFAMAILPLLGCAVSPDKSQAFLKLSQRVQALEENQKKSQRTVDTISYDLETIERDLQALKTTVTTAAATPGGNPEQMSDALKRVETLEQQLKDLAKGMNEKPKAAEHTVRSEKPAAEAAAVKTAAKPSADTTAKPRPTTATKSSGKSGSLTSVPRRQPAGFYYAVAPGDTLQSIASRHSVSSANLCRANRLPITAPLYAGQSLFIPRM